MLTWNVWEEWCFSWNKPTALKNKCYGWPPAVERHAWWMEHLRGQRNSPGWKIKRVCRAWNDWPPLSDYREQAGQTEQAWGDPQRRPWSPVQLKETLAFCTLLLQVWTLTSNFSVCQLFHSHTLKSNPVDGWIVSLRWSVSKHSRVATLNFRKDSVTVLEDKSVHFSEYFKLIQTDTCHINEKWVWGNALWFSRAVFCF